MSGIKMESVLGHRLSVDTTAELEKIDTSGLVDGDIAFVSNKVTTSYNAPNSSAAPYYMLLKSSTLAANNSTTFPAQGGGVWLQMELRPVALSGSAAASAAAAAAIANAGGSAYTDVTVTGVALGDYVDAIAPSVDLRGGGAGVLQVTGVVVAADTVRVSYCNNTATNPITPGAHTIYVTARKRT